MTEQIDLDALEARAKTRQAIDSPDVLALIAELRQERERADDAEGAYNAAVERHRLAAEKRDEYQQLYGDMADDERRARVALKRAEERADEAEAYASHALADRATSVAALARERERAELVYDAYLAKMRALSRAEETIEKAEQRYADSRKQQYRGFEVAQDMHNILTEYDKQKGDDRG